MSKIGQIERATQNRVVKLFRERLGYDYLGNWQDDARSSNIEEALLLRFLTETQGLPTALATRAVQEFTRKAGDQAASLYDVNKTVYGLLRYGVQGVLDDETGERRTVHLVDWKHPDRNHFAIAEEVSISAADAKSYGKRPDVVFYVNGIALGVLELKRSTVSVSEGIRQNLDNQTKLFIRPFFTTMHLIMAGNDTEGLRYGTIETSEKYYLSWKEEDPTYDLANDPREKKYLLQAPCADGETPLDCALARMCRKDRLLELIHDYVVFDSGVKKLPRHNQYFGVRAAQKRIAARDDGIIWHTQGSGKSLTMVWLAKWIRENQADARVLIITDRTELDEQIEKVFAGFGENIYRTKTGSDLIGRLNDTAPWLLCSLVHKFGGKDDAEADVESYVEELTRNLPRDFSPKGNLFVFVDECHRTQSGKLHGAMKKLLPGAMFIGFTGTPLLKDDKQTSIEIFGTYIHTYKFDEAVEDGVVLDLRYEARDIDQSLTSPQKVDQWFEAKTKGLTDLARAQLKQRWGTMQKVLSSQSRLERIVADIMFDMSTKDRLANGRGNAILVSDSIRNACKFYDLFQKTELAGKCAIVTSYRPTADKVKGETTGEGDTERLEQFKTYRQMLASWFDEPEDQAVGKAEEFEKQTKKKFIDEPGQMRLLIVVDKLLTGFDAPSATYLYIDKTMQDHGLFQAICRVNRLDGDDKEYGYIIDYKDLFRSLEGAIEDYTSGAFEKFDKEDVEDLLSNRVEKARERLEEVLDQIRALCEPVEPPLGSAQFIRFFCGADTTDKAQLKDNEPKRLTLYKLTASLLRAYAAIAPDMAEAGYSEKEAEDILAEVARFDALRNEIKLASGDHVDLKLYEPAMRHLIDTYIRAEESQTLSAFEDLTLIELIVKKGADAVEDLPEGIKGDEEAVAETIENNVRKLIIDEQAANPKYYDSMSGLLDDLIAQRRQGALAYAEYLKRIADLAAQAAQPPASAYPTSINRPALRALYDNLGEDEDLAIAVDEAVRQVRKDGWRGNRIKEREVRNAIAKALSDEAKLDLIFGIVVNQDGY